MGDLTKNFSRKEFRCRCGCRSDTISINLVQQIQKLRDLIHVAYGIEIPIAINSGFRCKFHNAKVGGEKNSYHLQGLAADISLHFKEYNRGFIWQIGRLIQIACQYKMLAFGAIGVYPGTCIEEERIHVDMRPLVEGTILTWFYDENKRPPYTYGIDFAKKIKGGYIL